MKRLDGTRQLLSEAKGIGLQQIDEEIAALIMFLRRQPRQHVLEIGSAQGGSFYLWCRLFSGKKLSLDYPAGNFGGIGLAPARKRNREFRKWSDGVTAILGDSHTARAREKVAVALRGERVDFLFIDADHTLPGVRLDYFMYRQFVRPGGYIAFHDINDTPWHRKAGCLVGKFWSELKGEKREFSSREHWGGIGLLKVGAEAADKGRNARNRMATILIVAATRESRAGFRRTNLGSSLRRLGHLPQIQSAIAYQNTDGLPVVFNRQITERNRDKILVFTHDDVRLDDYWLGAGLEAGLQVFQVLGVAGNRRRRANQPAWAFTARMQWDARQNLSGAVCHVDSGGTETVSWFGESKQRCRLLDGVLLAARAGELLDREVRFDERFAFHFYDLDFCRSAEQRGLRLGTWPLAITHGSGGSFGSPWRQALKIYRRKWRD